MKRTLESIKQTLAQNIVARRQHMRLSQEQLALRAEVDRTYISQIERAIGNPSLLVLSKIAEILEVDVLALLASEERKSTRRGPSSHV